MKMPDSFAARASEEAFDAFRLAEAGHYLQNLLIDEVALAIEDDAQAVGWHAFAVGKAYGDYLRIGLEVFDHIETRRAAEAA